MSLCATTACALLLAALGCEDGHRAAEQPPDLTADTPALLGLMVDEAAELESRLGVTIERAQGETRTNCNRFGCFYEAGAWNYGLTYGDTIAVGIPYHGNVVRHELLHVAGYQHSDQVINGVRVADHVDAWED